MSLNYSNVQVPHEIKFPPDECSIHVKNMEHAVGFLRGYISPIIVLFGVFGNMSAFYLFLTHKPFNRFSIYVMTLAISDSLVLISNTFLDDFLGRGLYYLTNERIMIKLDTYSLTSCRIMELIGCWFVFNSGCLLVAFSIDRVNCLFWPLRCRSDGGIGIATLACSFIIVIGFILSIPYAMLQKLTDKTSSSPSAVKTTINTTTTAFYANISSTGNITANNEMQMYNLYSFNCSNCPITTHHIEMPMKRESPSTSLACALATDNQFGGKELLSFVFSTVLTYMVPCILLVFINSIILIKLISVKTRRRILCKREHTNAHLINWTSNGKSNITPQNDPTSPTKALTSALATMLLKRRKHTILEDRKELGRVVALLLLSCFYLCFTFPVSISLTIRASLNDQHDKCVHTLYAHLSRLLTSIKDINYALNGYTYALFFQFYRHKLLKFFTCKFTTSANNNNTHYTRRDGNTATGSRNNRRKSSSTT